MRHEINLETGEILELEDAPINKESKEVLEQNRILSIKAKARDLIESKYPFYKQLNITNLLDGYTERDKTEMIDYINLIRKISNEGETNKTQLEDITWK